MKSSSKDTHDHNAYFIFVHINLLNIILSHTYVKIYRLKNQPITLFLESFKLNQLVTTWTFCLVVLIRFGND